MLPSDCREWQHDRGQCVLLAPARGSNSRSWLVPWVNQGFARLRLRGSRTWRYCFGFQAVSLCQRGLRIALPTSTLFQYLPEANLLRRKVEWFSWKSYRFWCYRRPVRNTCHLYPRPSLPLFYWRLALTQLRQRGTWGRPRCKVIGAWDFEFQPSPTLASTWDSSWSKFLDASEDRDQC